jgi:hypothetical protein
VAVKAGRGRGKGKAKGRGRGKFKGKAKATKAPAPVEGEEGYVPKPKKEKPVNLRAQVEAEVGDRDIQEVIKENRATVEKLQAAVAKAQLDEAAYETSILDGKVKMEQASAAVDSCVQKETLALEKFKAAKQALITVQKTVSEKKLALGEEDKALDVLASEGEVQKKEADLIDSKRKAHEAMEAAKKAYEEAKLAEKKVAEEMKAKRAALAITDDPEAASKAKAEAEKAAEDDKIRKEAKNLGKSQAMDLKAQLKELEKQRLQRDKDRAQAFKEAAGLGKAKKRLALGDGSAASPAKAAKIQDVD